MDADQVPIPTTRDVCVIMEHLIRDNTPHYDWRNAQGSFLQEFGDLYDSTASTEFICFAILEKTKSAIPEIAMVFACLRNMAADAVMYPDAAFSCALGRVVDKNYNGPTEATFHVPATHCIWYSCEHKSRHSEPKVKLSESTVASLLARLSTRIQRAMAVITSAMAKNIVYTTKDVEVLDELRQCLLVVQHLAKTC